MNHRLVRLRGAALCCVLTLMAGVLPASALPGQTIGQFKTWAGGKTFFRNNLETSKNELSGFPQFHVRDGDHGVAWDLQVQTDGKNVVQELFGLTDSTKDIGSEPIQQSGKGYGFTFFTSVYGAAVAADYKSAKLVASIYDPKAKFTSYFYKGSLYGYENARGYLALQTQGFFTANLAQTKKCAKTPENCAE